VSAHHDLGSRDLDRIQAYLDGLLSPGERAAFQELLASSPHLRAQVESYRALYARLDSLPRLEPSPGFAARVMTELRPVAAQAVVRASPPPLALRLRRALGIAPRSRPVPTHPGSELLQDFVDGVLPGKLAARVGVHVKGCGECRATAESWGKLYGELGALSGLTPSPTFREGVMSGVKIPAPAPSAAPAQSPVPAGAGVLDRLRRLRPFPVTTRGWAVAAAAAATPVAALSAILWVVLSHPLVTPGGLLSFASWQAAARASSLGSALMAQITESLTSFRLYGVVESLVASPGGAAAAGLALSLLTLGSLWVLYRNLMGPMHPGGHHAAA